jgi:hypothetical protein
MCKRVPCVVKLGGGGLGWVGDVLTKGLAAARTGARIGRSAGAWMALGTSLSWSEGVFDFSSSSKLKICFMNH